jgi:hypothetical protein
MKNVRRPTYSFLILVIGLILINSLLAWLSLKVSHLISPTLPASVSMIFIAGAFMLIFTLWFGMYGALAAYAGSFIGSGLLTGMPVTVALYFALANLWQVLIPLAAFRIFDVKVGMESRRDLFHLVLFGTILNNVVGAAWGSVALAIGGVTAWSDLSSVFFPWLLGNIIVTLIIVPLVLYRFTPVVEKSKVFVKNYWF